MPVHNRTDSSRKQTIGMFASLIPIEVKFSNNCSFADLMVEVGEELSRCYRHQRLSIADINRSIGFRSDMANQLYDITFSFDNLPGDAQMSGVNLKAVRIHHSYESLPLAICVSDYHNDDDVHLEFAFN